MKLWTPRLIMVVKKWFKAGRRSINIAIHPKGLKYLSLIKPGKTLYRQGFYHVKGYCSAPATVKNMVLCVT